MTDRGRPPFVEDPSAIVLIDFSWWTNAAFRCPGGVSGMMANCVGRLTSLLSFYPAHVAYVRDTDPDGTGQETFRHKMRHPSDSSWEYKASRKKDPKPREFYVESDRVAEIFDLHSIPCLRADGWEADDVLATATRLARAANYRVWIVTSDKDLGSLCERDEESGVLVGLYDDVNNVARGPREIHRDIKVWPEQVTDLLAIAGDPGDGVPGVDGLGGKKTVGLLERFGTLDKALASASWNSEQAADVDGQIDKLAAALKAKAPTDGKKSKRQPLTPGQAAEATALREKLKEDRDVDRSHAKLLENADVVRFSKALTTLDDNAPIEMPWDRLPTGDFNVPELRARYTELRFMKKAEQVPWYPKAEPWGRLDGSE